MSTTYMSQTDAANVLGVTTRTIRSYTKTGLLRRTKTADGKLLGVEASDVYELAEARAVRDETISAIGLRKMAQQMARLRADVDTLMRIMDTKNVPLGITAEYARDLVAAAQAHLAQSSWAVDEINAWSNIFLRLTEEDLEILPTTHGWVPLLKLAGRMLTFVRNSPDYASDLELQKQYAALSEGRSRLREAIIIFSNLQGTIPAEIRSSDSILETLQRIAVKAKVNPT